MKQLRYLVKCMVDKATIQKQENGSRIETYENVKEFLVQPEEITDSVSINLYGARINNMYRLTSPYYDMENYLKEKLNASNDNISKYSIVLNDKRYRIEVVRNHWIDIELIWEI